MSRPNRHVIRKASIEVSGGGQQDAFRFQQEAVSWAHDRLLPELEEVFASLPDTVDHVILDRLEVEVDASDAAHWGTDILPKLKAELITALIKGLQADGRSKGEERYPAGRGIFQKLAYYLEHGVLPWNLEVVTPADFEAELGPWIALGAAKQAAADLADLFRESSIRTRFLETFQPSLVVQFLTKVFMMPEALAREWTLDTALLPLPLGTRARSASDSPSSGISFPPALLQEILGALAHNPRLFELALEEEIIQAYLGRVMHESGLGLESLKTIPFKSFAFSISRGRILRQVPGPRALAPQSEVPTHGAQGTTRSDLNQDPGPARSPVSRPDTGPPVDPAKEGIYIHNAGLILLAPFLTMLFERLDLAKSGAMKDEATAMALQHYLVTGLEGPAEFQVVLPKVLCAWPLEKAISLPGTLAEAMKQEAGQLLESVIGHWGILKSTSVEGLRESFLQRQGKLSRTPKGDWLLQVEQKAYDMLLQQLPWSFNLIRLPWMKNVLRTEWIE